MDEKEFQKEFRELYAKLGYYEKLILRDMIISLLQNRETEDAPQEPTV